MNTNVSLIDEALGRSLYQHLRINPSLTENFQAFDPWKLCSSLSLFESTFSHIQKILNKEYTTVVSVSKWGFPFAVLIASRLGENCKLCCLDDSFYKSEQFVTETHALLVDDVLNAGTSIKGTFQKMKALNVAVTQYICILDADIYPRPIDLTNCHVNELQMFALTRVSLGMS